MIPFLPLIGVAVVVAAIVKSNKNEDTSINGIHTPLNDGKLTTIEKVKIGEWFKLPNKKTVYVARGYNRFEKKYESSKYDDINHYRGFKKGTKVEINFTF
jgi:hypothetical protein